MKKCIIMPDSFKGTLSAIQICSILTEAVRRHFPVCEILAVPVADGGEGTVDCFLHALHAEEVRLTVKGPFFEPQQVRYARQGKTAIIEMAQSSGLPLVEGRKNPERTTTFGVGQMLRHAVENGCTELVVGLGGSCTNDAGTGAAAALGVRFLDAAGEEFVPTGGTLDRVARIDTSAAETLLAGCSLTAMCDIDNPMHGPEGAACVFGPQKGADAQMVRRLDEYLRALDAAIRRDLGKEVSAIPGAGAAGAMGAGIVAFLGGRLQSGIRTVLDLVGFDAMLEGADLVFTGEGRIDGQSLRGKVVIGIAERARRAGVPVVAIVGAIGEDAEKAHDMGVSAIFSINRAPVAFEEARHHSAENLAAVADEILRFRKAFMH